MSKNSDHRFLRATRRILQPFLPRHAIHLLRDYVLFWVSYRQYARLSGQPCCAVSDIDIRLGENSAITPISYYFHQDTWAFHQIAAAKPDWHVDVGSTALLVSCIAALTPTISVDIRPLAASVQGLTVVPGSITALPFDSDTVPSLSALCVIEHIGLGRYGDALDPAGSVKAAAELTRILKPGGNLYVSAPCGRSYTAFNAHRSFTKDEFIGLFPALRLVDFMMINDRGVVIDQQNCPKNELRVALCRFTK